MSLEALRLLAVTVAAVVIILQNDYPRRTILIAGGLFALSAWVLGRLRREPVAARKAGGTDPDLAFASGEGK
jgi:hypothetical protein